MRIRGEDADRGIDMLVLTQLIAQLCKLIKVADASLMHQRRPPVKEGAVLEGFARVASISRRRVIDACRQAILYDDRPDKIWKGASANPVARVQFDQDRQWLVAMGANVKVTALFEKISASSLPYGDCGRQSSNDREPMSSLEALAAPARSEDRLNFSPQPSCRGVRPLPPRLVLVRGSAGLEGFSDLLSGSRI